MPPKKRSPKRVSPKKSDYFDIVVSEKNNKYFNLYPSNKLINLYKRNRNENEIPYEDMIMLDGPNEDILSKLNLDENKSIVNMIINGHGAIIPTGDPTMDKRLSSPIIVPKNIVLLIFGTVGRYLWTSCNITENQRTNDNICQRIKTPRHIILPGQKIFDIALASSIITQDTFKSGVYTCQYTKEHGIHSVKTKGLEDYLFAPEIRKRYRNRVEGTRKGSNRNIKVKELTENQKKLNKTKLSILLQEISKNLKENEYGFVNLHACLGMHDVNPGFNEGDIFNSFRGIRDEFRTLEMLEKYKSFLNPHIDKRIGLYHEVIAREGYMMKYEDHLQENESEIPPQFDVIFGKDDSSVNELLSGELLNNYLIQKINDNTEAVQYLLNKDSYEHITTFVNDLGKKDNEENKINFDKIIFNYLKSLDYDVESNEKVNYLIELKNKFKNLTLNNEETKKETLDNLKNSTKTSMFGSEEDYTNRLKRVVEYIYNNNLLDYTTVINEMKKEKQRSIVKDIFGIHQQSGGGMWQRGGFFMTCS